MRCAARELQSPRRQLWDLSCREAGRRIVPAEHSPKSMCSGSQATSLLDIFFMCRPLVEVI